MDQDRSESPYEPGELKKQVEATNQELNKLIDEANAILAENVEEEDGK